MKSMRSDSTNIALYTTRPRLSSNVIRRKQFNRRMSRRPVKIRW